MKVTVCIDSFKGSLSTFESAKAVSEGILRVYPDAEIFTLPLADGGEGTVEAIASACDGHFENVNVHGPLNENVAAKYVIVPKTKTAVMEMSQAAGITLVDTKDRNPMRTTTYGVGQMILDAIEKGCRNFLIGIGGSATNDAGVGMLQALGFEFLNKDGKNVSFGAEGVGEICKINTDKVNPKLTECTFNIACDVKNPLCGENGCSAIYGPQKGATEEMVKIMDKSIEKFASLTKEIFPNSDKDYPGAGAAGGLGFAFMSYLFGTLKSGVELVTEQIGLEEYVKKSDVVVTGEGRLDSQSVMGKAPVGVARVAKKHNKKVIAFCGVASADAGVCNNHGIDAYFPIISSVCTLKEAMDVNNAYTNLANTAEQVFRVFSVCDGE